MRGAREAQARRMNRNLEKLPAFDDAGHLRVIVEATAGTRSKLKYQGDHGVFELHHVLPAGTAFPLDFGFIPGTLGEDGDPLDALVFADEPTHVGVLVPCRLVGVLTGVQSAEGEAEKRNDRFLAVVEKSHTFEHWDDLADIPGRLLDELETFFVSYNAQRGVRYAPK